MKPPSLHCLRHAGVSALLLTCATLAPGQLLLTPASVGSSGELRFPLDGSGPSLAERGTTAGAVAELALPSLPDAPSVSGAAVSTSSAEPGMPGLFVPPADNAAPNVAPKLTKYIPSGFSAQPITAHDKVLIGLRDLYSPLNFVAMVASAGYEHAVNGEPNYGTDRGAFGQRLGAAAIRESTQGLFTDTIFAPVFHQDPRYYVQGSGHNPVARLVYAGTRPLITRTDHGHSTVNAALLAGYASSTALSYTYYPKINQNFNDMASAFGGSIGGAALGFVVSEFSDDLLKAVHLKKK